MQQSNAGDVLLESFSEDEGDEDFIVESSTASSQEVQNLLDRKVELEKQKKNQELHSQHVQVSSLNMFFIYFLQLTYF